MKTIHSWPLLTRSDIINAIREIDPKQYGTHRNYLDGGTRLSPYITRGLVTLPEVYSIVREQFSETETEPLLFELAWREYWQREWWYRGDAIFSDIKHPQERALHKQLSTSIQSGSTGITVLDAAIQDLYDIGYIHNHARMWIAGLATNIAQTKWWEPSMWMYYHLLDGDPASNILSWQWIAGTFSSKKYVPTQQNINTYSKTTQLHTFLDHDFTELLMSDVPKELQDRTDLSLAWQAPTPQPLQLDITKPTVLYHPFWLNGSWQQNLDANRVLLLEPDWFNAFPVNSRVTSYILNAAKQIPGMQVVAQNFHDIDFSNTDVYYMNHPSVKHWNGKADRMPQLFPHAPDRSFNSFMSFWSKAKKSGVSMHHVL